MRTERGITLVEVLATVSILSIIGITIWQIFFQGYNFSQKSITKNMLQQQSNIVISSLTRIHQTIEEYTIVSAGCNISVRDKNNVEIQLFTHSQYCFRAEDPSDNSELTPTPHKPSNEGQDLDLKVRISEKNNPNNFVAVRTLLYRLKEGEKYE
ncbi:Tfp pilus assembly protein PilE [Neobacillus niacini]|uniref:PulJ/GspJ family protein n=1 Tax=Neobacillus driksii TaxID=3035913 RepID=UPI0027863DD5|nr:prepilin-type N-terminal cleavage/methylation domain-containing protein [Neobacillus niacini]MDQ0975658.1 Tfp pilus assembly protein PilE [Neobacillus niacini]